MIGYLFPLLENPLMPIVMFHARSIQCMQNNYVYEQMPSPNYISPLLIANI